MSPKVSSQHQGCLPVVVELSCLRGAMEALEPLRVTVTWAFVQLPGLSYVSLTEPHTLADGWPDAIVVSTGEDGV